jgi:ferredoxin
MPHLLFVRAGITLGAVEALPGDGLLDVARQAELPLHWRCGQGTCGTCRVHLRHAGQPACVAVTRKERNVLLRAGLIDADAAGRETWPDDASTWRLACHLRVGEVDWTVDLPAD